MVRSHSLIEKQPPSAEAHSRAAAKHAATKDQAKTTPLPNKSFTPRSACDPLWRLFCPVMMLYTICCRRPDLSYVARYEYVWCPMMAALTQRSRCRQQYPFTNVYDLAQYLQIALASVRKALTRARRVPGPDNVDFMKSIATGIHFLTYATGMAGRLVESQQHIIASTSRRRRLLANRYCGIV